MIKVNLNLLNNSESPLTDSEYEGDGEKEIK